MGFWMGGFFAFLVSRGEMACVVCCNWVLSVLMRNF